MGVFGYNINLGHALLSSPTYMYIYARSIYVQ